MSEPKEAEEDAHQGMSELKWGRGRSHSYWAIVRTEAPITLSSCLVEHEGPGGKKALLILIIAIASGDCLIINLQSYLTNE